MEIVQQIVERWGLPAGFAAWLMFVVTKDLREIRDLLSKQAIVNAVILKTLDVPGAATIVASDNSNGES